MVPATIKTLPRVLFFTLSSVLEQFIRDFCGAEYGIRLISSNHRYMLCIKMFTMKSKKCCFSAKQSKERHGRLRPFGVEVCDEFHSRA
ncbi:hypothetical protein D8Z79_013085 [Escherichia fergusonii]|nr:hypothetical protein [Escherichia fergusonii]QCZ32685.1 hypothetical protein D8Z79_013085 [Escherichia fergusonii]RSK74221.1 hypothetical protein D7Z29_03680 [Escherichia fergusonii]